MTRNRKLTFLYSQTFCPIFSLPLLFLAMRGVNLGSRICIGEKCLFVCRSVTSGVCLLLMVELYFLVT